MGMYASYDSITAEELAMIKQSQGEDVDFEAFSHQFSCNVGKMWDVIHFLLTGQGTLQTQAIDVSKQIFNDAVFGKDCINEEQLEEGLEVEPILYNSIETVKAINQALASIPVETIESKINFDEFIKAELYPDFVGIENEEETRKWILEEFINFKAFYESCAQNNLAVMVYIG